MNVYEAIGDYLMHSMYNVNGYDARVYLAKLIAEYDALAPDWANAPDWAQWITIFDNGKFVWWELEPEARIMPNGEYAWTERGERWGMSKAGQAKPLPEGIDWRLCKWQRPEVTK